MYEYTAGKGFCYHLKGFDVRGRDAKEVEVQPLGSACCCRPPVS